MNLLLSGCIVVVNLSKFSDVYLGMVCSSDVLRHNDHVCGLSYMSAEQLLMMYPMSQIRPGLFLGCCRDATDIPLLENAGVTHVLSLMTQPLPDDIYGELRDSQFVQIDDSETADLLAVLENCLRYVAGALEGKGKVLVHW